MNKKPEKLIKLRKKNNRENQNEKKIKLTD